MSELSQLPSIDQLLKSREMQNLLGIFGRPLCVEAARAVLGDIRTEFIQHRNPVPDHAGLIARVNQQLEAWLEPSLVPVINATGVVLHTNLGRAPLSQSTRLAIAQAAEGYTNLEFNL